MDTIFLKTRSEVKVTVTQKWYATLRHPKMHLHTKFGIPTSKNIGDMDRTRKRDGHTDGRTVRLLYASQSSFGGIKNLDYEDMMMCQTIWRKTGTNMPSDLGPNRLQRLSTHYKSCH